MKNKNIYRSICLATTALVVVTLIFPALTTAQSETGYAPVNGLEMYYEIHGSGEPLILLHGGLGSTDMFDTILPTLSENRQVIAVDLQGHGRTADIDRPIRLEYLGDDIAAFIRHLGLGKVDIVGYSMGGGTGLRTAIQHPEVVKRLVVISAPFSREGFYHEILAAQAQVNAAAADAFKSMPLYQNYVSVAPNPENFPQLLDKLGEFMSRDYDWSDEIRELDIPVMLIFADADMFPTSHMARFFELLGGGQRDAGWDGSGRPLAQLAILPGLTHYDIFMSPELASTVMNYLNTPMPGESRRLVITRVFEAPVEEVWKAWSESEYIKQWWGPHGFTAPVTEIDFREGGTSLLAMSNPEFGTYYNTWTYTKIEPMKRIEFIHRFSDKNGTTLTPTEAGLPMPDGIPDEVPHVITFTSLSDNRTELTVKEFGYTTNQAVELSKMGMEQCLEKMAEIFVGSQQ